MEKEMKGNEELHSKCPLIKVKFFLCVLPILTDPTNNQKKIGCIENRKQH